MARHEQCKIIFTLFLYLINEWLKKKITVTATICNIFKDIVRLHPNTLTETNHIQRWIKWKLKNVNYIKHLFSTGKITPPGSQYSPLPLQHTYATCEPVSDF